MSKKNLSNALLALLMFGVSVSAGGASTLGDGLTPTGAEQAGNAEGTIPAWTGGITEPVAGWKEGERLIDPFSGDRPTFSITSENVDQHGDRLTQGQKALFERYPGYRMDIYPTRRSCALPQRVYDVTERNMGQAALDPETGDMVAGVGGVPFPLPKTGAEAMWNHRLGYFGEAVRYFTSTVVPYGSGQMVVYEREEVVRSIFHDEEMTSFEDLEGLSLKYFNELRTPKFLAGEITLVHEPLNAQRRAWQYNPGSRRVRRAPSVAYDNPVGGADGTITHDQWFMFNGRLDRYDWKLIGKQELYIPYNNYALDQDDLELEDIVDEHYPNRDLMRYELHRVWKVEATRKDGFRHIMPRRVFYLDEDSWRIMVAEAYDSRGDLWRVQEQTLINAYQIPSCMRAMEVFYDLNANNYVLDGVYVGLPPINYRANESGELDSDFFTPARLRKLGRR